MPAGTMHRHGRLMGKRGVGMRKGLYTAITALFVVLLLTGCGGEQAEPLDLRAEYAIDAVLEPEAERLAFTQSVTVRNGGDNATEELWFQLRANRFAAEDAKLTVPSPARTESRWNMSSAGMISSAAWRCRRRSKAAGRRR